MNLNDLRNLDPNNIGSWPAPIKAVVILILCAAVLGAGYWFFTQHKIAELQKVRDKEQELRGVFETKQRKAANLEPLKELLARMKKSFEDSLRLLPNRTEIEGLLVDISQSGLSSGLEFELFKPGKEAPQEFYAVQPIQIVVTGTYHEFGEFISAVAALPRIVTQHDITMTPVGEPGGSGEPVSLRMSMTAKTYRYLDADEIEENEN